MDRNDYPGDANMQGLRKTFVFHRLLAEQSTGSRTAILGSGRAATCNRWVTDFCCCSMDVSTKSLRLRVMPRGWEARRGRCGKCGNHQRDFRQEAIIFLGPGAGRAHARGAARLYSCLGGWCGEGWLWGGIYCSGIAFRESSKVSVVTANDIRDNAAAGTSISLSATIVAGRRRDACFRVRRPLRAKSGVAFADVWQYAQSPRRPEITSACRKTYAPDDNCYPPGNAPSTGLHIDVDAADSADPSRGRSQ